ncbi:MAG: geranylgeranylglyceryl/heptaprenylglyceryl phosphate synthase [Candidatus Altiarchaeota archaeon]|nr:geranylgeranylglyceryl/heptaprenylglyceryl phosphate synthase [Candidatus Altiarchaeota archaeon]
MNVLREWLGEKKKKLHFTLIDPDKQAPEKAAKMAATCSSYGTDAIMVGGSTVSRKNVEETVVAIKDAVNLPIILFPNSSNAVTESADYIFFMCLLNSKKRRFLVEEQLAGALAVKEYGIHPISMGYIVVSTSKKPTTVESIADLDIIQEGDIQKLLKYALTAEYYGMQCVYLEAGSGAEKPVPNEMIMAVHSNLSIPLIVGGGIRDGKTALDKVEHGADVIVTGTIAEENQTKVKEIIEAVKEYDL